MVQIVRLHDDSPKSADGKDICLALHAGLPWVQAQSIQLMPEPARLSFEELRLKEYSESKRFSPPYEEANVMLLEAVEAALGYELTPSEDADSIKLAKRDLLDDMIRVNTAIQAGHLDVAKEKAAHLVKRIGISKLVRDRAELIVHEHESWPRDASYGLITSVGSSKLARFINIFSLPRYRTTSFEELRLHNYNNGDRRPQSWMLKIPAELRNRIYDLVLCTHISSDSLPGVCGEPKSFVYDNRTCPVQKLSKICRQMRAEVLSLHYMHHMMCAIAGSSDHIGPWIDGVAPETVQSIRSLLIRRTSFATRRYKNKEEPQYYYISRATPYASRSSIGSEVSELVRNSNGIAVNMVHIIDQPTFAIWCDRDNERSTAHCAALKEKVEAWASGKASKETLKAIVAIVRNPRYS